MLPFTAIEVMAILTQARQVLGNRHQPSGPREGLFAATQRHAAVTFAKVALHYVAAASCFELAPSKFKDVRDVLLVPVVKAVLQ